MKISFANIMEIARKELGAFFSSLSAFVFLGVFLLVTHFIFFWVDPFFARNIADVRTLFDWMPVLLIFLVPALTMRMWSEERRAGTVEYLLTISASNLELVLGKFVGCLALVVIALALTLPIPITVSFLGPLDWGPVFGGYFGALCLASAYAAIGLYVSTKSDNQIVSLLVSVLICSVFLLIGSETVAGIFGNDVADNLRLLSFSSRFESIARGVIDLGDFYFYLSISATFLALNVLSVEELRWAGNRSNSRHVAWLTITALAIANFIAANFWLQPLTHLRVDLTQGHLYSISPATKAYISQLKEPLLLRGYFSKKTHPYLAPIVPRLKDLMKEYAVASGGKVRVEFLDPVENPEIEKEAGEKYGIKPATFQTANKYQTALTNSYFDVLVKYGDQFEKMSYKDILEVKQHGERQLDVDLRNPEYDITRAIKKVLFSYQSNDNPFAGAEKPVKFIGYFSPDTKLPEPLIRLKEQLQPSLKSLEKDSQGKFTTEIIDPDADDGKVAKQIESEHGFKPMVAGLVDSNKFWFYMALSDGSQFVPISLQDAVNPQSFERTVRSSLRRFTKGFLKTIGISSTPESMNAYAQSGTFPNEAILTLKLKDSYTLQPVFLSNGYVPIEIDVLLLIAPLNLTDKALFAIDQYLMRGGTVIICTSPFDVGTNKELSCKKVESGLKDLLASYGLKVEDTMVLDPHNFALPIPVRRNLGGFFVDETKMMPYPYFVDVRQDGMDSANHLNAGIDQIMMSWASPITVDKEKSKQHNVINLLKSSAESWTSSSDKLEPNFAHDKNTGFYPGKDRDSNLLAVITEGKFESFFKDKPAPVKTSGDQVATSKLDASTDTARIILFGSTTFITDKMLFLATQSLGSQYLKPVDFIENTIDWSVGDRDLLTIRGRGHYARTLRALVGNEKMPFGDRSQLTNFYQMAFEYFNYGLAFAGLLIVWLIRRSKQKAKQKRYLKFLQTLGQPKAEENLPV